VTPPFKPVVESDESTANFDPEFTSADIREIGLAEMDLDEEDPSEDWVSQSIGPVGFTHTPNGPLGSDKDKEKEKEKSIHPIGNGGGHGGIQIKTKRKKKEQVGSPLTNSVQENFRGFTYSGGESVVGPPGLLKQAERGDEEALDDEEVPEVTTEDEYEDFGNASGRYSNRRKGLTMTSMDDEMQA
jgi:hypothetical protein